MFHAKNQTSPKTIDATGYMPYILRRQRLAEKASKNNQCSQKFSKIAQFWAMQKLQEGYTECVQQHAKDLFRSKWECNTDKRGLHGRVQFEMSKIMDQKKLELRERQDRLKDVLDNEKSILDAEIKAMNQPEVKTRKEMLDRYSQIMTQNEVERRKIVEAKRDHQFRNNCPELRTLISEKICKLVTEEGKNLNEERNRINEEKLEEDQMYADAWFLDAEAKRIRESEQERLQKEKNMLFGKDFLKQFESRAQKRNQKTSHEDEAQLMHEQQRLFALEKEWEQAEKKIKQRRVKKDLDKCLKEKLKRRAKEVQEDLMLDLYFLDKILAENDDDQKKEAKKQALKKEQDEYLAYLTAQIKKEGEFEREIEKLQDEETKKMWAKREKEWEAERKRREALNKKNIRQLYEQIRNKMEKSRLVEEMKMKYDEEIKKQVELDRKYIEEKEELNKEAKTRNRKELEHQIRQKETYVKQLKQKEQEELQKLKDLQDEYDRKIDQIVSNPKIPNLHPYRSSH